MPGIHLYNWRMIFRGTGFGAGRHGNFSIISLLTLLCVTGCARHANDVAAAAEEVQPGYVQSEATVGPAVPETEQTVELGLAAAVEEPEAVNEQPILEQPSTSPAEPAVDSGDILWIQQRLQELGYYQGSVDGSVGLGTRGAIEGYQRDQGIAVDGQPSAELREYMWRNGG